ncbi:MAG: ABC transporter permease [Erysipelotrichales bacterium]|nr:MAG: ABC transporter permease [Erysipelotrichales bacterium]
MKSVRISFSTGVFLLLSSWIFLPWGEFKINRVARGAVFSVFDLLPLFLWLAGIITIILMILLVRNRKHLFDSVVSWAVCFVPVGALLLLGGYRPVEVLIDSAVARISIGAGFYFLFIGTMLILSQTKYAGLKNLLVILSIVVAISTGALNELGLVKEYRNISGIFSAELNRHIVLALSSALAAIIPGVLMGYAGMRYPKIKEWVFGFVHVFQVAPTLSLLALMMIPLATLSRAFPFLAQLGIKGIGFAPAFIVLFLYSLLPITVNTYAGLMQTDPAVLESALALGMTQRQRFRKIWFPLSLPSIFAGIRTAMTQNIGNTILAGLVGGGGMGALIFLGLSQSALDLVLLGTIPVVVMALGVDAFFAWVEATTVKKLGVDYDPNQAAN